MKLRLLFLFALLTLLLTGCAVDNAALLTLQGRNQDGLDRPEQARLWYDQAIAVDPNFAEAYYGRAMIFIKFAMSPAMSPEAYDQAIADLDRAIVLRPEWAQAYFARTLTYLAAGHTEQAYEDFKKYVALYANLPTKFEKRMAMCFFWALDDGMLMPAAAEQTAEQFTEQFTEQMVEGTTKAIELDPGNAEAYFCRAFSYFTPGDFEKAVPDLDRVIELSPSDAMAYYQRAAAYSQTEDITEPETMMKIQRDLAKAFELDPDLTDPYGLLALLYFPSLPAASEDE